MSGINVGGIKINARNTNYADEVADAASTKAPKTGVIDAKVKTSNSNDLNVIGNMIGQENIKKKIDHRYEKLVDRVIDNHENGNIEGMIKNIQTGEGLTAEQHDQLDKIADALSPGELNELVAKGKISQEDANFLMIADALQDGGVTGDAKGRGLAAYLSMSPDAQKYCAETMADRDTHRVAKGETRSSIFGIGHEKVKFKEKDEDLNPVQQRMAAFLASPRHGPGNVQNFMTGNFDTSTDALTSAFAELPTYNSLPQEQQEELLNSFYNAGVGGGPGGRPGDAAGPDQFKEMGFQPEERQALSTLMYQVMADRVSTLDQQVRGFADRVQKKNDELKTYSNAMTKVQTVSGDSKKDTDFSDVTFEDASGKEVSLAQFLIDQKVANESDIDDMSATQTQEMLSSLQDKSDIRSSESSQEMTKLQQSMDKYNQSTTAQTNLQSKFNTLDMSIRRNLAQ
ncbi:MAG: hypothetical protein AAF936_08740 [Pseudomonadota bacterium]